MPCEGSLFKYLHYAPTTSQDLFTQMCTIKLKIRRSSTWIATFYQIYIITGKISFHNNGQLEIICLNAERKGQIWRIHRFTQYLHSCTRKKDFPWVLFNRLKTHSCSTTSYFVKKIYQKHLFQHFQQYA